MKGKLINVSEEDNYYFRYKPDALHCKSSRSRSLSLQKTSPITKRKNLHWWTLGSITLTKKDHTQFQDVTLGNERIYWYRIDGVGIDVVILAYGFLSGSVLRDILASLEHSNSSLIQSFWINFISTRKTCKVKFFSDSFDLIAMCI